MHTQCIETDYAKSKGYGHRAVRVGKRKYYEMYAHQAAFILAWGDIPSGMSVRHSCDNPGCINPMHLMLGSHAQNMKDMAVRRRASKHRAKITQDDANVIRLTIKVTGCTQSSMAAEYGVHQSVVSRIMSGLIWKG